jgi:predicted TIM-barrel fold metal-dependent hydrolase
VVSLTTAIEELRLIDHHMHLVLPGPLTRPEFEQLITESDQPAPAGTTEFDSQLGFAVRRWCGAALGLDSAATTADAYLLHRNSLPGTGPAGALLPAAGCSRMLVDTGFIAPGSVSMKEMAALSGAAVSEVVRLEAVAEELARTGCAAADFASGYRELLRYRSADAVGLKSIIAYRFGLDFDPLRPSRREVAVAAGRWLHAAETTGRFRLEDPVLLREVLWAGVERGLPVQMHTGFGDPDLNLRRADPLLAREFLAATAGAGAPVVLLHCYPFHRHAGFLAQQYPHVYMDVGMALSYVGARAAAILAETLELAPFAKVLYSSDAYGLPELIYLGARLWRNAMIEVLGGWLAGGQWTEPDAIRVAAMIGAGNAARLYQFAEPD